MICARSALEGGEGWGGGGDGLGEGGLEGMD